MRSIGISTQWRKVDRRSRMCILTFTEIFLLQKFFQMSLQTEKEQNMSCQDDLVLHRSIYSDKEDRWSLDLENVHLQGGSLDKSCSKSFKQLKYIIKMVIKTPLSSTDPIKEQEDRWSLDLENVHLQRGSFDKSCSKSFR